MSSSFLVEVFPYYGSTCRLHLVLALAFEPFGLVEIEHVFLVDVS